MFLHRAWYVCLQEVMSAVSVYSGGTYIFLDVHCIASVLIFLGLI